MMLKHRRQGVSLMTVAAENANFRRGRWVPTPDFELLTACLSNSDLPPHLLSTREERMEENITLNVTLSRANAAALLKILNRRVETLQGVENHDGPEALAEATQEKDTIITILMALDAAVKTHRHAGTRAMKPILELLSQKTSKLPSLEAAEEEACRALAQAAESAAQAHAAFAASLSSGREIESSAAIGVEELKLQRAQAAYDTATERVLEAKGQDAEANRKAAYAQSQRAHDEAVAALRQYEPLALEMLKLFSVLAMHADLALADVEVAERARINPHTKNAAGHLKTALEQHGQNHAEAVIKHVMEALHQLELAAE